MLQIALYTFGQGLLAYISPAAFLGLFFSSVRWVVCAMQLKSAGDCRILRVVGEPDVLQEA